MSDRMAAEIRIGGRIPLAIVPDLCAVISDTAVGLEYGECQFSPRSADELLAARIECNDVLLLDLFDDQATWGEFQDLEQFLQEQGIAYDRFTEGKYEYGPETALFRPGHEPVIWPTTPERRPIVLAEGLEEIEKSFSAVVSQFKQRKGVVALAALQEIQKQLRGILPPTVPDLISLAIVNLSPTENKHGQ